MASPTSRNRAHAPALALAALALIIGCSGQKSGNSDFGGLLYSSDDRPKPIDVGKVASGDAAELGRAVGLAHRHVTALVGPHRYRGSSKVELLEGDKVVESLSDESLIDIDAAGNYLATLDNSKEYGRHAVYAGGLLYLRPRFGKYHRRLPTDSEEPARVRDEIFGSLAAYFDLLAPAAEVSDGGATTIGERAVRKIKLGKAPIAPPRAHETGTQKQWRQTAIVDEITGEVLLDAENGVPLRAKVSGEVNFVREGKSFTMKVESIQELSDINGKIEVVVPPPDQTVATPMRATEVEERELLLDGIAPPAAKAPTPGTSRGKP